MISKILAATLFITALCATASRAQEELPRNEVSAQGTGFFTKDSNNNGVRQDSTDSGGLLISYRNRFNSLFGADLSYGYARNTQQNFTALGTLNIQSDIHQATAALLVSFPNKVFGLRPFALAGGGALTFDPTNNPGGVVPGAGTQARGTFVYGGGANFDISQRFAFRLEYRGLVYRRPNFGLGVLDSDAFTHTAQPSAGFVVRF